MTFTMTGGSIINAVLAAGCGTLVFLLWTVRLDLKALREQHAEELAKLEHRHHDELCKAKHDSWCEGVRMAKEASAPKRDKAGRFA